MQTTDIPTPTDMAGQAPEGLPAKSGSSRFDRWPLNVNPEMDAHAARLGLSHWSCVSTKANNWWIRADGQQFEAFLTGSRNTYMEELEAFDLRNPMNAASETRRE